jgi:PAS domain-containing protein
MTPQEKGAERFLHDLVELRRSRELYETVLSRMSEPVLVAQGNEGLTFIGPTVGVIFGCSVEEVNIHVSV